jgi:hypothetical protein
VRSWNLAALYITMAILLSGAAAMATMFGGGLEVEEGEEADPMELVCYRIAP